MTTASIYCEHEKSPEVFASQTDGQSYGNVVVRGAPFITTACTQCAKSFHIYIHIDSEEKSNWHSGIVRDRNNRSNKFRDGRIAKRDARLTIADTSEIVLITTQRSRRNAPSALDFRASFREKHAAGYQERDLLYVVLAAAIKALSNYSNQAFGTQVDDRFGPYKVA